MLLHPYGMVLKNVIKLNVGGLIFVTKPSTLEKFNSPVFNEILKEFHQSPTGEIFVDRDGTFFGIILNFLRTYKLICPYDKYTLELLLSESQHYQLKPLIDAIKAKLSSLDYNTLVNSQQTSSEDVVDDYTGESQDIEMISSYSTHDSPNQSQRSKGQRRLSINSPLNVHDKPSAEALDKFYTNPFETPVLTTPVCISESQDIEETNDFVQSFNVSHLGPQVFDATLEDF